MIPLVSTLERSFADVAARQSEITNVTLPQWHTALLRDLSSLRSDLPSQITKVETSLTETLKADSASKMSTLRGELESTFRLSSKDLTQVLDAAKEELRILSEKHVRVDERLSAKCETLEDMARVQQSRTVELDAENAEQILREVGIREGVRLTTLEEVVRAMDYERLARQEVFSKELIAFKSTFGDHGASLNTCSVQISSLDK